jgi:ABC-type dipeptide/oligopeptide/nickel transport system permease subunit
MVEEFSNMLNQTFSKDEIISAQNQVLEVAKSVADVSTVSQLYVTSDRQLTDVIANDVVQVSDLVHAAIFNLLPDLLVLAKEDEELNKGLENSKYKDLIEVAKGKLSDLTNEEVYVAALSKAKTSMKNAEDEMKEIGLDISYKNTDEFLEAYAGMELAKVSIDISNDYRAKVENELARYSSIAQRGFVAELNNIFLKIASARSFMSSLLGRSDVPDSYETLGSKVIEVLSDPVSSLMAYAFQGTKKLDKVIASIENSQFDDYRRLDIIDKLKTYKEPIEAVRFLIGEGDIDDNIYTSMVDEHKALLLDDSIWDTVKGVRDLEKTTKTEWSKSVAESKLVAIFNDLSVRNKIGVAHPLPPSRWHLLGTDPIGRDVFIQLMVSTPSEFLLGVLAAFITVFIGTIIGTASAYYGGAIDLIFMRVADLMMLFPSTAFLIVLSGFMSMDLFKLALILGLLGGFGGITLVLKAQALTVKVKPYIDAARASGGSHGYIIFNHIIPNVMPLSFLYMMFNVTGAIFSEATLSFFGLMRVRMSWGLMINTVWSSGYLGSGNIGAYWWMWIPAGGAITLLCSAFYFLGRGLEEIVNPRLRKR